MKKIDIRHYLSNNLPLAEGKLQAVKQLEEDRIMDQLRDVVVRINNCDGLYTEYYNEIYPTVKEELERMGYVVAIQFTRPGETLWRISWGIILEP